MSRDARVRVRIRVQVRVFAAFCFQNSVFRRSLLFPVLKKQYLLCDRGIMSIDASVRVRVRV